MIVELGRENMRKGITPIIAIIVLLLITVALAGTAWTYLSSYMTGLTGNSYDIRDSFCVGGDTGVIMLANTGTRDLPVTEISIIDQSTGSAVAGGSWSYPNGTGSITMIPVGDLGRWDDGGACGSSCSYRVVGGTGRAITANIFC
jgi:flagellin-like protein